MMAAADRIAIEVTGRGAHAAKPHEGLDPIVVASHMVGQIQSIVARSIDPLEAAVISITQFHAGSADNIIPQTAELRGTARTLSPAVRDLIENRLRQVVENTARAHGADVKLNYLRDYPVTVNHPRQTEFAASIAAQVAGPERVRTDIAPVMGAEDFSYMLEARPGAYIFVGNGESANLHHPAYDFNDAAIPFGASYWIKLVETAMPA
jgi:hippurate hydrolase